MSNDATGSKRIASQEVFFVDANQNVQELWSCGRLRILCAAAVRKNPAAADDPLRFAPS
jgi:hypothetical protein